MKLAYSSNAFKKYSLLDTIRMVYELGFEAIEIMADVPHLYPPHITSKILTEIKATLKETNLTVSNINSFTLCAIGDMHHPSWIEKDKELRKIRINHTIDCIELAKELNCLSISIQPGGINTYMDKKEAIKLFAEGLGKVKEHAKKNNIKILIEPEPDLLIENSCEFENFMKIVDDSVFGLNFDIGHFFCVGEDPANLIKKLKNHIGHFHIEDIAPTRVHNHLIPGLGAINFKEVLTTIEEIKYTGFVSVELYPYQDDPISAGKQAISYLQSFLQ